MDAVWRALSDSFPPATSRAQAAAPSVSAQKTRCMIGGSGLPLAVMQSMTKEPESEEVMKYRTMTPMDRAP